MDNREPMPADLSYDEEIAAFLIRESDRRTRLRPTDSDVVAAIRRRASPVSPSRTLAGLTAATLLAALAIVASALVLRAPTNVGPSPSLSVSERPLRLPAVAPGQACPVSQPTPGSSHIPLLGDGPVRLALASDQGSVFFEVTPGGAWKAIDVLWAAPPGFTGQVLVRGARLDGPDELRFGDPVDPLRALQISNDRAQAPGLDGLSVLATTAIRVKAPGCYGLQIDVGEASSIVVFQAKPIADAFALLERPVQLPRAGSAGCPVTATTGTVPFIQVALGNGPVYVAGGSAETIANTTESGGYWLIKEIWIAGPTEPGPILVRGGRIDAPGDLRFGDGSQPPPELRLPIHSYEQTDGQPPGWRIFNGYLRLPGPGCYAMQLDTLSGTRWLVFDVIP